jgi:hypothetical protein
MHHGPASRPRFVDDYVWSDDSRALADVPIILPDTDASI